MKLPKLTRTRSSSSATNNINNNSPSTSPAGSMRSPTNSSPAKRSGGSSPCFPLPSIVSRSRSRRQLETGPPETPIPIQIPARKSPAAPAEKSYPDLPAALCEEYEQVFRQFDADGDGRISAEEVRAVLTALGEDATPEDAARMVNDADLDGDGYIDWHEFVGLMHLSNTRPPPPSSDTSTSASAPSDTSAAVGTDLVPHEEEEEEHVMMMKTVFGVFDLDGDGRITAEELYKVLSRLGGTTSSTFQDCRRMISSVDRKGAGLYVDFDDFHRMMTATHH